MNNSKDTNINPGDNIISLKKMAAEKAVDFIKEGMVVGLGTGSTVTFAIDKIAGLVQNGMKISAVCTSVQTAIKAEKGGIFIQPLLSEIDITIDGADEIDDALNLIKGGGGALLREKMVAYNSKQNIIIADASKKVHVLGRFPLAVEVLPFGVDATMKHIEATGCRCQLRMNNTSVFKTDNGHYIADCKYTSISQVKELNAALKEIPGVLETGLFPNDLVHMVILASSEGQVEIIYNHHH